jgi:hypothetical protein
MQQHKRRTVGGSFGKVQLNFAGIAGLLDDSRMRIAQSITVLSL